MEDTLSIIFATIIAILLMFMFPMMDTWDRQDDLSYMSAYSTVVDFVDSARNTGYITEGMINDLEYMLSNTGNSYDIEIEHRAVQYVPTGVDGVISPVYIYHYKSQIEEEMRLSKYDSEGKYDVNIEGRYNFSKGDYLYVSIKNTNKTPATLMKEILYATRLQTFKVGVPYGGMVRNDPTW